METRVALFAQVLLLVFSPFLRCVREPVRSPVAYSRNQLLTLSSGAGQEQETQVPWRHRVRRYRPVLPSVTTRNVRSLPNKMDQLTALTRCDRLAGVHFNWWGSQKCWRGGLRIPSLEESSALSANQDKHSPCTSVQSCVCILFWTWLVHNYSIFAFQTGVWCQKVIVRRKLISVRESARILLNVYRQVYTLNCRAVSVFLGALSKMLLAGAPILSHYNW